MPWNRVLGVIFPQLLKKFPSFYGSKGSLQHSQNSTSSPYPQADQSKHAPIEFLKILLNIILPSTSLSSKWFLSVRFAHHNPVSTSPVVPICATCLAYLTQFDFLNPPNIWQGYISWNSLLCYFLQSPVISSHLGPNIFFSTLFLKTLNLCSSCNTRGQVLHTYNTTEKITILHIFILILWITNGKTKY